MRLAVLAPVFVVGAALAVTACQTSPDQTSPDRAAAGSAKPTVAQLVAARQGEEVSNLCFASQINGWSELGRDAVLVRKGVNDWYKLDLSGGCDPQWAFNAIAIRSRPAGTDCITRGDRLTTDDRSVRSFCLITGIHKWNDKAPVAPAKPAQTPSTGSSE